jgi:tRNA(fMet)-specific endonuclease VapC
MTLYLLDTNTLTLLQQGHARATAALQAHAGDSVAVTSVNVEEALGGWYSLLRQARTNFDRAQASLRLANAFRFLAQFPVLPLTETALDRADQLARQRLNVGLMDLKIAALALELGATVVSNDLRDFSRVPGLADADWSL